MDFEAISYPEDATFTSLLYEIENPEIASITDLKITGLKSGETNLVIKADEPGNAYSIKVPVYVSEDDLSKPLDNSFRRYGDEAFSLTRLIKYATRSFLYVYSGITPSNRTSFSSDAFLL